MTVQSITAAAELRMLAAARQVSVRDLASFAGIEYQRAANILAERRPAREEELRALRGALFAESTP